MTKPTAYVDVGKNYNASAMRRASGPKLYGICVGNSPIMWNIVDGMRETCADLEFMNMGLPPSSLGGNAETALTHPTAYPA